MKYELTKEINELFDRTHACNECRDIAIKLFFTTKKAIFYATEAKKANDKAWQLVYKLYPELKGKSLSYDHDTETVHIMTEDEIIASKR